MPTKKPAPLPDALRYLQPFANALARLPPDELNEDVDSSRLEAALRKRLRGLDADAAAAAIDADRDALERWLKGAPEHPAHWILGFLRSPDLAAHLAAPVADPPRGPAMHFDAPAGWKVKAVPFRLDLRCGKMIGTITAVDAAFLEYRPRQIEHAAPPPGPQSDWEKRAIAAGDVSGKKYVCRQTAPAFWNRVEFCVPGGFVSAMLDGMGTDFDESPFDATLHTIRLGTPA